jgi:glycosyltransferase involved in cell wall biosynthesis
VLFLTPYFRPYLGGIERAIEQLTFQIQKSQAVEAVGVLTTKYSFPRVPQRTWADRETTTEGIAIFRLSGYPRRSIPLYSVPLVWFSPLRLRQYLREFNPNVIHFVGDGWFWGHFWAWFWFRRKARFVFTPSFHTLPVARWWLRPINGFLCNVVDRVVALTRLEADLVRRAYWVPGRKQEIIGWGASPPEPTLPATQEQKATNPPLTQEAGTDFDPDDNDGSLTILCVGRLGLHKGQGWLLHVFLDARTKFQHPVKLILVGRDEGEEATLVEEVQAHGLENEVILAGEVSDGELTSLYSNSDLFALFSRYEAFGLVFFEAMTHGVPVLTHDVGANRELLIQGAEVVAKFDHQAAVQRLIRLVNDDDYRDQLGREAREYALAEFTWAAVAEKYLQTYVASED